jgi:hypothetical protein
MAVTRVDRRTGVLLGEDAAGVRGIGKFCYIEIAGMQDLVGRQSAGGFDSMRQLRMAGSVTDKRDWELWRM